MNKKISLGLALSLVAIASAVTFILTSFFSLQSFNEKVMDVNEKAKKYSSLQVLDAYVRENYLGEINESELNDGILKGYAAGLNDKYSRYLSKEEYIEEMNSNEGNQVGLGLTLQEDSSGYIRIIDILPNSPASDSELKPDDIIIKVNGEEVITAGFDASMEAMSGVDGAEVTITVRRDGIDTDHTLVRRSIEIVSVTSEMLNNYIGYIKIDGFKNNTPDQFIEALERLTANGAKALIFDVRDNGGGSVTALEDCLDPLLPEGVIATAEYKDGHSETIIHSDSSELELPMVVLMNENTASAAELFSVSLKDFGKAELVGTQTYGKGVMQTTAEFDGGGAVILTVANCKTTVSDFYNGIGISPDYSVKNENENYDAQQSKAIEVALSKIK
ncbi:MAG TPA: S41 family peptidase [Ruminococcus sp.]